MPIEVRYSPAFLRARRRRNIGLGLFGILLALVSFGAAIVALRDHTQVRMGPPDATDLPPELVIAMAVLLFAGSVWIILRERK